MITAIELMLVFSLAALLRVWLLGQYSSTDDWGHLARVRKRKVIGNPFDYRALNSIVEGKDGYPQLYHYLISLLPERWWAVAGKVINVIIDLLLLFFVIVGASYFIDQPGDGLLSPTTYAGLLFATSPALLPVTARFKAMGARVIGTILYVFLIASLYLSVFSEGLTSVVGSILSIFSMFAIVYTSQFTLQAAIWTVLVVSVVTLNPVPLVVILLTFLVAWYVPRLGMKDILLSKVAHWNWYFRNAESGTGATGRNMAIEYLMVWKWLFTDPRKAAKVFLRRGVWIIVAYSNLPMIAVIAILVMNSDARLFIYDSGSPIHYMLIVSGALLTATLVTSFKVTSFLGQAERYLEYSIPIVAILVTYIAANSFLSERALMYLVLSQLVIVLLVHVLNKASDILRGIDREGDKTLKQAVAFINRSRDSRVLTIPTKLSFNVAGNCDKAPPLYFRFVRPQNGNYKYMEEDHARFDLVVPDFEFFKRKYGINTILASKAGLRRARDCGIDYDAEISKGTTVLENESYIVVLV